MKKIQMNELYYFISLFTIYYVYENQFIWKYAVNINL